ncbi:type 2 periplasmic-binding domain-containing protein [Tanticharoenia sakaeratensis]|uniref:Lipoprotein n=1 Tax=Tanticharoenia sakaeratensis NBRC 103193 TaxID=1231623 RepID=A0A0D6MK56_9PROT|nr:hypothetical protein [Tanticharoenia sakaeratensis]GAN54017.1 lipoprotein [Tanticharoenia sakaeratensis NBRC 103193]GBQ23601.1 putative lipoprotein [Tanticharoenia sakaeratensis NBRC 103193]
MRRAALRVLMTIVSLLVGAGGAHAQRLSIRNDAQTPASCRIEPSGRMIAVPPRTMVSIVPAGDETIDTARCNGLSVRALGVLRDGVGAMLRLNGRQTRVLNVALYPFIPSLPDGNFDALVAHVVAVYQHEHPDVLLHAAMSDRIDIYDPAKLKRFLSRGGFDVMEIDTLYLRMLAGSGTILPAHPASQTTWPAGLDAVTVDGVFYGVPSWLCLDFIYMRDPALKSVRSLPDLLAVLSRHSAKERLLSADLSGTTRLPSIYMNAYAQDHGYESLSAAMKKAPDADVIHDLAALAATCSQGTRNPCADGTLTRAPDGEIDRQFAIGESVADIGFSEQSFYIDRYAPKGATVPTMIPVAWGRSPAPMLYSDAFVTSAQTCSNAACGRDAEAFTRMMTGAAMKTFIAFSEDLRGHAPPRHLLVATRPFWDQSRVRKDPVYRQVIPAVRTARAFPSDLDGATRDTMALDICRALRRSIPSYDCGDTRGPM